MVLNLKTTHTPIIYFYRSNLITCIAKYSTSDIPLLVVRDQECCAVSMPVHEEMPKKLKRGIQISLAVVVFFLKVLFKK